MGPLCLVRLSNLVMKTVNLTFNFRSVMGYILMGREKKEYDYDAKDDKARRLAEIASYTSEKQLYSSEKTTAVTFGWDGIKTEDVTEQVATVALKGRPNKYKDPEYLSVRANMSKDDPKFDVDFWVRGISTT